MILNNKIPIFIILKTTTAKEEKMKDLNDWLLWIFWAALGLFAVVFAFYVASILIPILLIIILVSGLGNLFMLLYKTYKAKTQADCRIETAKKRKPDIIDAEYEIIDDK